MREFHRTRSPIECRDDTDSTHTAETSLRGVINPQIFFKAISAKYGLSAIATLHAIRKCNADHISSFVISN